MKPVSSQRIDRLDNAFLFILSFVGLLASFLQVNPVNSLARYRLIPFLFLGILWPFYIGYLNGAIKKDNIAERIRGWIYFFVSTGTYFAFYLSNLNIVNFSYEVLLLSIPFWMLAYFFIKWLRVIFPDVKNINYKYAYSGTFICSIWLSFIFTMSISIYLDMAVNFPIVLLNNFKEFLFFLIIDLASFILFVFYEKASNQITQPNVIIQADLKKEIKTKLKKFNILRHLFLASYYGTSLLYYTIEYDLKIRLYMFVGYWMWIIGSIFFVFNISFISTTYYVISMVSLIVGLIKFIKIEKIDFTKQRIVFSASYYMPMTIAAIVAGYTLIHILS